MRDARPWLGVFVIGLLGLNGIAGCDAEEAKPAEKQAVTLSVRTVDLTEAPVENVRFYINGKKFGITDQDGTFKGRYDANDGDTLMFNVEAPPGYSVPPNIDQSRWQYHVKYPADGRPLQINFTAQLQRPEREYLFMVRAEAAGTPVKVNNKVLGKAGPNGNALLRFSGVPGSKFTASAGKITTSGKFAEDDEVYLLTATRSGALTSGIAKAAPPAEAVPEPEPEPAAEPPEPEPVAAAPEPVAAAPEPVRERAPEPVRERDPEPVVAVAAKPAPARDVFADIPAPAREARRAPPPPPAWDPPPEPRREARREAPREPDPIDDMLADPEPIAEPEPVAVVEAPPPPLEIMPSGGDDLLLDDPPPAAPMIADAPAVKRGRSEREAAAANIDGLADDGEMVDQNAISKKTTVGGASASLSGMSKDDISARLSQIQGNLARTKVLGKSDVDFLSQVDRTHPGYREANRLLADFYYKLKDYRRQTQALEVATKRGRYKHDPNVLLSLAKAYARQKRYRKALSTMRRVESKSRNLGAKSKADAYRFYAEILEFEFLRQYHDDAKGANITLVDKAISKWERYRTFARGADPGGVSKATGKIKELEELKTRVEL